MIAPRWRKVLNDLWSNKVRTLLVVLSIGIGVFAVGMVGMSFNVILNDMQADYDQSNPHAAEIYCDTFTDDLLGSVRRVPGVGEAEGRSSMYARIITDDEEMVSVRFEAVPTIDEIKIDMIESNPPGLPLRLKDNEVFIEQSAVNRLNVKSGDMIKVELPNKKIKKMMVADVVHNPTSIPFVFSNQVTAYVTPETMQNLGGSGDYTRMMITVSENKSDEAHVNAVAELVGKKIEKSGREVYDIFVYQPGRHFASDITSALGTLMSILGVLAVFLSAFLVINTINALLSQHIRYIGMMKSIGGRSDQIFMMYLVLVLCFGILALIIAGPLSVFAGYSVAKGIGTYLNFDVGKFRIPANIIVQMLVVGLIIPVAAAMVPVLKGTRVTIREATSSYGIGSGVVKKKFLDRMIEKIKGLPRPLLISIRNTFRRRGRLILTLSTLSLAGGIFIAVINLQASFMSEIQATLGYFLSDVTIGFNNTYRLKELDSILSTVPEVEKIEGWGASMANVLSEDGLSATEVYIIAPPAGSPLIEANMKAGRWLMPEDENALVIGNHLLALRPELGVGDEVVLEIDDRETTWTIVGVYQMAGNVVPPLIYANYEYLAEVRREAARVWNLRVVTTEHDAYHQRQAADRIEAILDEKGIGVSSVDTGQEVFQQNESQISMMIQNMMIMAVLIAVVGGLGLSGTMSMNVLERTREIGVMRSIGARNRSIFSLVIVEGMIIGIISWIIGSLLSFPISLILNYAVGISFIQSPMRFILAINGYLIWLLIVLILSALASLIPARSATRLTIREVLAYE